MKAIVISGKNKNGGTIYFTLSESWQFAIASTLILSRVKDVLSLNPQSEIKISVIQ